MELLIRKNLEGLNLSNALFVPTQEQGRTEGSFEQVKDLSTILDVKRNMPSFPMVDFSFNGDSYICLTHSNSDHIFILNRDTGYYEKISLASDILELLKEHLYSYPVEPLSADLRWAYENIYGYSVAGLSKSNCSIKSRQPIQTMIVTNNRTSYSHLERFIHKTETPLILMEFGKYTSYIEDALYFDGYEEQLISKAEKIRQANPSAIVIMEASGLLVDSYPELSPGVAVSYSPLKCIDYTYRARVLLDKLKSAKPSNPPTARLTHAFAVALPGRPALLITSELICTVTDFTANKIYSYDSIAFIEKFNSTVEALPEDLKAKYHPYNITLKQLQELLYKYTS